MKLKKFFLLFFSIFFLSFLWGAKAFAVCPLCAIAVGAGIEVSRWLGVDDSITGLWSGALLVALIILTINWLRKKNVNFRGLDFTVVAAYYILTILPLYFFEVKGGQINVFNWFNFDKLLLGIIVGSVAFYCGACWNIYAKEKNNGKVYFPFQKVVFPILPLFIISIIFYFIT